MSPASGRSRTSCPEPRGWDSSQGNGRRRWEAQILALPGGMGAEGEKGAKEM